MDVKSIENLAKLMKENGLTSLELAQEGISLKLERKSAPEPAQAGAPSVSPFVTAPVEPEPAPKKGSLVLSPTVGVFYAAASPESSPYVSLWGSIFFISSRFIADLLNITARYGTGAGCTLPPAHCPRRPPPRCRPPRRGSRSSASLPQ